MIDVHPDRESSCSNPADLAIERLKQLHEGEAGVVDAVACGKAALPGLRRLLFERDRGGIFEIRRRAVRALESLSAYDILREFLARPHDYSDPGEQTAEDAIVNAAARAIGALRDRSDLAPLLSLLDRKLRAGVIEAVGNFEHSPSLPRFIEALGDDFCRPSAETAILKLGLQARSALVESASRRDLSGEFEVDSSKRCRRSTLRLLLRLGPPLPWPKLRSLIDDPDPWIAVLSGRMALESGARADQPHVIERLIHLLDTDNLLLRDEIEECLFLSYAIAAPQMTQAIKQAIQAESLETPWWSRDKTLKSLLRVERNHNNA